MWRPSDNKLYVPPPAPVSKVITTDAYVTRTKIFYHASSSRLLAVGNPYFPIRKGNKTIVPKVSGFQFRVFKIVLPDPNKFALPDTSIFDSTSQRLVWACIGLEVGRGQPLGVGISGHPLLNKFDDVENSASYAVNPGQDNRVNVAMDYKQTQLCLVGCAPPLGEHWGKGTQCSGVSVQDGDCPPLELVTSVIQDGDMVDTGFGAMDFAQLQSNKSDVPLDICTATCKYPDYLQMAADPYGDRLFFSLRKEQMFARHFFNRAGTVGEQIPEDLLVKGTTSRATVSSTIYFNTPSGSLVSSEAQLFNKPYWLHKAQGHNNGICWGNTLFVTVVDTTRSTNMTVCASTTSSPSATYTASEYKQYMRHVEEFDLQFIFQLCSIKLTAEVMAYIHTMNPTVLEEWNFGLSPPPNGTLEDTYRYVQSQAITCQKPTPDKEKQDPYAGLSFWEVNLKEKFSSELDQYPLGRKFLLQTGVQTTSFARAGTKRAASTSSSTPTTRKRVKRK
ncbi:L1 [Pygmy chimpanzee papillomavirus type 1]|uniref:Major capsid protein L1 n=1 Tax=Pygmy chimpanzee papillomavirus type 1 TaxID=10576 RepID=VL1_PCPV1|nr:RecName: Full=Major capsid protein L1 [Pygmy chimpanzee papillomavirus type 1]pir/P1WLC1/ L1 protein - pygmy chimpanzee papillomavirus (type 1) [Pygmy chimpanzee papillomavirus type 1]CAA44662.1 L1 [Pygmy chimpanzee papillomavirus type 1]